ncbi:MAG: hypothetical protein IJL54_14295 [Prevotella sp.]|nr:hypothetical protein [Prevotella sp.]
MRQKLLLFLLIYFLSTNAQTDVTSKIVNPNFDGLSFAGWQQQGMQFQTNDEFSGKANFAYVERWVSKTGNLPDTYIKQTIKGLAKGRYMLTVSAQLIKQESTTAATGGYVFADWQEVSVTTAKDYTLTFDVLTDDVTIGFKVENATGNWMACDNFRLSLVSSDVSYMRTGLSNLITKANGLVSQSMDNAVKSALETAISNARNYTSNGTATNVQAAAATLKNAMLTAERSIFATKTSTTGTVPTVVTNKKYARGATMIFGRSTITSSSNILEQGFCYSSTNAMPTVADERSTRYVENGGRIYCMDNLTPSTLYYIRAYAITNNYKVGYGDVIKVYTLPKGNVTYGYGNEGDDMINARISQSAMSVAELWSNLTSINGAYLNVHYASGTPTADCSYGGYIRVGPTESYQATGTLLHEMGHGIGVGTHSTYTGDIRSESSRGIWYGKRATRFLQFWDNSDGVKLTGDGTHLWATGAAQSLSYTINGAHEDNHSDASYYGNSLLMQAVVEDGLAPVGGNLQGLAYTFEQEDEKAYFIRNSDANYGLNSAFLVDNNGTLQLKVMSSKEAQKSSNNAMWNFTFNPATQTYRIKNQSTGRYVYYATDNADNGFKTTASTASEIDLRLQLSFVDVQMEGADKVFDCYHIMRKNSTPSPQALCAMNASVTGSTSFSNTRAATAQRWVILDADELQEINPEGFDITQAMAPYLCTGSLKDWKNDGMVVNYRDGGAPYVNTSDGARVDFPFIERWVSSGNTLPNSSISQTIRELPNGTYDIRGSIIACQQSGAESVTGVTFYAGNQEVAVSTANGTPTRYSLRVVVTDGTLTYGLKVASTTANWVAMDHLSLYFVGTEEEYYSLATNENPVRVPIVNPTFDDNDTSGWSLTGNWSTINTTYDNFNPPFAEWWVNATAQADRSMSQTLSLRDGKYMLQAAVEAVRQDQPSLSVSGVNLKFDDTSVACHTADHAPQIFKVEKTVEEGEHTFGLYVESTDANWVAVDNFVLYYYGNHYLKGDVNNDGRVDITDVICMVNRILSVEVPVFIFKAADMNEDGEITITDVTALVNAILEYD